MVVRVEKETAKTKKGQRSEAKKVDCDTMLVKTGSGAR